MRPDGRETSRSGTRPSPQNERQSARFYTINSTRIGTCNEYAAASPRVPVPRALILRARRPASSGRRPLGPCLVGAGGRRRSGRRAGFAGEPVKRLQVALVLPGQAGDRLFIPPTVAVEVLQQGPLIGRE